MPVVRVLCAAIAFVFTAEVVGAVMVSEPPVPLPDDRRARLEQSLSASGFEHAASMVGGALHWPLPGQDGDRLIVRLADPPNCVDDLCLTLIVDFSRDAVRVEAMFMAGPRFAVGDVWEDLGGIRSATHVFDARTVRVAIRETRLGWIVAPRPVDDRSLPPVRR